MKTKLFATLLFVLAFGFTTMAQSISIGPRVGTTFAKVTSEDISSGNLTGLQVGAVLNYGIDDLFSVQPELLLVQKGGKIFGYKQTVNYAELPVLGKATFDVAQFQGFVTAGPTFGYAMGGKYKGDGESTDIEWEDEDNRFEMGASFGIGLGYKVGTGTLNLDIRYGLGITSLYETEGDEPKSRNSVVGISLAYLFSL